MCKLEEGPKQAKGPGRDGAGVAKRGRYTCQLILPVGADHDKTLDSIVTQLERIAELIDPEGPTYG